MANVFTSITGKVGDAIMKAKPSHIGEAIYTAALIGGGLLVAYAGSVPKKEAVVVELNDKEDDAQNSNSDPEVIEIEPDKVEIIDE